MGRYQLSGDLRSDLLNPHTVLVSVTPVPYSEMERDLGGSPAAHRPGGLAYCIYSVKKRPCLKVEGETNIHCSPASIMCFLVSVSLCFHRNTHAPWLRFNTWHNGQKKSFHFLLLSKQRTSWFQFCCCFLFLQVAKLAQTLCVVKMTLNLWSSCLHLF